MNWLKMPSSAPLEDMSGGLEGIFRPAAPGLSRYGNIRKYLANHAASAVFCCSVGTNRSTGRPTLHCSVSHREALRPDGAGDDVRNRYNGVPPAGAGTGRQRRPFDLSNLQGAN